MSNSPSSIKADATWHVEVHGIDPIPQNIRHGNAFELFKLWVGANTNYVVVVTGGFILSFGLSLTSAITAILVGNALGCIIVGMASIMGPRTGTAGIVTSRTSFGQLGSFFPKILSVITALSWFSINAILATEAINKLFAMAGVTGVIVPWIGLAIILVLEVVIAIYGHATIIFMESYIAILLAVIFAVLAYFVILGMPVGHIAAQQQTVFSMVHWLSAMSLAFSFPVGWSNYASDYSRYFPETLSWKKVALAAGLGQFVAVVLCEILGVLVAILVGGGLSANPVAQLANILPVWFVVPLLLGIIVGGIAANVPNGYTAGLGLLALRMPIKRVPSLLVIALFTLAIRVAVMLLGDFVGAYENFLAYMSYWIAPWAAIVVVDYFLRRGHYDSDGMMQWKESAYWYRNGIFWPGIVSFIAGICACILFSNSSTLASPLMTGILHLGDCSFEAGIVVAGLCYYVLAGTYVSKSESRTTRGEIDMPDIRPDLTAAFCSSVKDDHD